MKKQPADDLKAVQAKMDALRSELLKFSEGLSKDASQPCADPSRLALLHSIMTIQEAMQTFMAIASARDT